MSFGHGFGLKSDDAASRLLAERHFFHPAAVTLSAVTGAPPRTLTVEVKGPLALDLPGLYARVCALLAVREVDVVLCGVASIAPDAVAVDALARLQLAARRRGAEVRLHGASSELRQVVAFMGLAEALPDARA